MKERINSKLEGKVDPTDEIRLSDDQVITFDGFFVIVNRYSSYIFLFISYTLMLGEQLHQSRGRDRYSA